MLAPSTHQPRPRSHPLLPLLAVESLCQGGGGRGLRCGRAEAGPGGERVDRAQLANLPTTGRLVVCRPVHCHAPNPATPTHAASPILLHPHGPCPLREDCASWQVRPPWVTLSHFKALVGPDVWSHCRPPRRSRSTGRSLGWGNLVHTKFVFWKGKFLLQERAHAQPPELLHASCLLTL